MTTVDLVKPEDTVNETVYVPAVVGAPLIWPEELSVKPEGKEPEVTLAEGFSSPEKSMLKTKLSPTLPSSV